MTDQSGAFPETLREVLERIRGYAQEIQRATSPGDAHDCARHIESEARAALERPRPAPPQTELHVYESEPTNPGYEGKVTVKKFSELRNAMSPERQQRAHERAEEILTEIRGGTAGTGAAPPGTTALTVVLRDLANGIAEALHKGHSVDSELRYALIWQSLERHGWNTLGVRGGAAQPPPSAPSLPDTFVERVHRRADFDSSGVPREETNP